MLKFQCFINGKYVQKFGVRLKKSASIENTIIVQHPLPLAPFHQAYYYPHLPFPSQGICSKLNNRKSMNIEYYLTA